MAGHSPVDVRVVATWPVGSFAENLAVHPDGSVFVRLHTPQRIDRYDPMSGRTTSFADLLAPGMGLAFDGEGTLWATGGAFPQGPGYVWRVAQDGPFDFGPTCRTHPSSMNDHSPRRETLLACESMTGRIPAIDMREPQRWSTWLTPCLARSRRGMCRPGRAGSPLASTLSS